MKLPTDYTPPPTVAWTGGSPPPAYSYSPTARRLLISHLFREQVRTFAAYWNECPDMDTARIFWNRAKHDAHATIRDCKKQFHELTVTEMQLQGWGAYNSILDKRHALSYSQTAPATRRTT